MRFTFKPSRVSFGLTSMTVSLSLVLLLPIFSLFILAGWGAGASDALQHVYETVLVDYINTSLGLLFLTAIGAGTLGVLTAWLMSAYDVPFKKILNLGLVLPLAMPTYVMAYAYTDFLQYSGPVQTYLRVLLVSDNLAWFPEIRSIPGASLIFSLAFYPYVYLLARTSFTERSAHLIEVARSLGLGPVRLFWKTVLPMARPAVIAGITLVLMETLADYGTVSYFGIASFSTGITRTWLNLGDQVAAAQLAITLLCFVAIIVGVERQQRRRLRFFARTQSYHFIPPQPLSGCKRILVFVLCVLPVIGGFILPSYIMLNLAYVEWGGFNWERYQEWLYNSLLLSLSAAGITLVVAVFVPYSARLTRSPWVNVSNRLLALGYAIPGVVLAIAILSFIAMVDQSWVMQQSDWLISGSVVALLYAYLVRFLGVGLQTVESGLSRITPSIDGSAQSLGVGKWPMLWRIHIPLLKRSLLTAFLLVFVDVSKELPVTLLLRPFNFDTLAVMTSQFAADERLSEAAIPALSIVLIGLLPVFMLARSYKSRS